MEFKPETLKMTEKLDKKREDLKGKVLALKDLVNYQDGTVASRMIINRKAGSISLFSFDENEGLSEHTAPYDATITTLRGGSEVGDCDQTYPMTDGVTILYPANAPHARSAITRFKRSLTRIRE